MNKKMVLTSCGIIDSNLKQNFYKLLDKDISKVKILFITAAVYGENNSDTKWIDDEFKTILDLGIKKENIQEFKMDYEIDLSLYDLVYMLGGNTFYLLKKIRDTNFDLKLKEAIENGVIYVGSSAGSVIMGSTTELSLPYDKNRVNLTDFSGLKLFDGIIIPHANRKREYIAKKQEEYKNRIFTIDDDHGIIVENDIVKKF